MADNHLAAMTKEMFRPPVNRAMCTLDKSFFHKEILTSAARIPDEQRMSSILKAVRKSQDVFGHRDFPHVREDAERAGAKCIVLRPTVKADGMLSQYDLG